MKQDGELVELISEAELLAATRIDRDTLRRVRRWLFWEPVREFPGRGSKSYYPAYAVPMIRRFQELRRATRKIDECVWQLWIEKFEFDIRKWAAARLADMEKAARKLIADRDDAAKGAMDLASTSPKRTSGRRSFHSRVRQSEEFTLLLWAFDVISGRPPAKSLNDPGSPVFDALKKAAGLKGDWAPPDPEPSIEDLSIERLNGILRSATDEEFDQAHRDWTRIGELVKLSGAIDWHTVRNVLGVARTSSGQPPAPLDLFFANWRNPCARGFWLVALIHFRRSPAHSQRISEILAWAGWALAQFPQHNHAPELAA